MKSITLKRIGNLVDRHSFLSSLLLLTILGTIMYFYVVYTSTAYSSLREGGIKDIIFSVKLAILDTWFCALLVSPISILLFIFLRTKPSCNSELSFPRRFAFSSFPALCVVFLITLWTAQDTPGPYAKGPFYLYTLAIFIASVYTVMFGGFFGWQSKSTKTGIVVQSITINILMAVYYAVIYLLSNFSM